MEKIKIFLIPILLLLSVVSCKTNNKSEIDPASVTTEEGEIRSISGSFQISGIYPHLTTYTHRRIDGKQSYIWSEKQKRHKAQWECGIGALAEWQGKLYMVNYAAHEPEGSEHSLYSVDEDLNMEIFPGSVGGTPASRMVHQESKQLFIGHYAIDSVGNIRVIDIKKMPGRLTAIARHLKDPENYVYYYDMEGMLYEVNVHTLEPNLLGDDPLPGWHGKGAYTAQGKLIIANNGGGRDKVDKWQVDTTGMFGPGKLGVLAEYDGENYKVIERKQYTDVTTKHGVNAVPDDNSPLWSMGWDKRSVRLKVMENGEWATYLLPKATYNNDPGHGWFTEWPRIREICDGRFMMDMHGMFFDFPSSFSSNNAAGLRPIGSHLRYIPDFMCWNDKVVLATDETSIQGNPLAGQPQSNLWFGDFEELSEWGPASAYGAIWIEDDVKANTPSLPFMFGGFDNKILHITNNSDKDVSVKLELDKKGNNSWSELKSVAVAANGYSYVIFDANEKAEWIRLSADKSSNLTASFHFTDNDLRAENTEMFKGIAPITYNGDVIHGKLYPNHDNLNLTMFTGGISDDSFVKEDAFEINKYDFSFKQGLKDTSALNVLDDGPREWKGYVSHSKVYTVDEASVILKSEKYNLRLPKGKGDVAGGAVRQIRELQSEREMANIHGSFYELPLMAVGMEARYPMMRPVSTHNRNISDYATWNGLLLISGIKADGEYSDHIIKNESGDVAVWMGGIDDLWKFGKPVGEGGVWKDTEVKAGERSDWFLMTGYDKKTVELTADKDVNITLYVHVSHYTDKMVPYKTFEVKAGETVTHEFPKGFSAHWAAAEAAADCKATVWFKYE
jgi:hypothetical protein